MIIMSCDRSANYHYNVNHIPVYKCIKLLYLYKSTPYIYTMLPVKYISIKILDLKKYDKNIKNSKALAEHCNFLGWKLAV